MRKSPISEVLIDATRLLESGELSLKDQQAICETIRDLTGREILLYHTDMQRELLVAKAWATTASGMNLRGRKFGPRKKMSWESIRAILAEVPLGE
jgi:hypothetical protein